MLYSMTGYGSGTESDGDIKVFAEVRSINSRFLETSIRLPPILSGNEHRFVKIIGEFAHRGKVMLNMQILSTGKNPVWQIYLDENLLDIYASLIKQIESRLKLEHTVISLDRFLTINELFKKAPYPKIQQRILNTALSASAIALKKLRMTRRNEGKDLQNDIKSRVTDLKRNIKRIKQLHDNSQPMRFKNLRNRVEQLVGNLEIDQIRLAQEVAYLASKADCTEEIIRFESHLSKIEKAIKSRKPVGSLLNFILQECHREVNTIGSKTDIPGVTEQVINLKEECERIKEQIQNIE